VQNYEKTRETQKKSELFFFLPAVKNQSLNGVNLLQEKTGCFDDDDTDDTGLFSVIERKNYVHYYI